MKRYLMIFIVFGLITPHSFSAPVTIYPGLTLEQSHGTYYIHFEMPKYDIVTDTFTVANTPPSPPNHLVHAPGDYYFSRVEPVEEDYFDYLSVDGRPELPFYSLNLLMPPDGDNYVVVKTLIRTESFRLPFEYTPSQAENYTFEDFSYDNTYYGFYNNTWYWDDYADETLGYRNTKGITFSIFPCHYEPYQRMLTVVTEADFEITYDGTELTESFLANMLATDRSIYNFYDNYVGFSAPYPQIDDEYLIITADAWDNTVALADFIHHKESLGYHVTKKTLHDIGISLNDIRQFIKSEFEINNTKFVLLVGNVGDADSLAFSSGFEEDYKDPPTDIYYSCLSQNDINDQWKDYSPSVFVGRWPIQDSIQLRHIVDKTIASDLYMGAHNPNEINIFVGDGHHKNYTYNSYKYIFTNVVQKYNYYSGCFIDGRNLSTADANDSLRCHLEDDNDNPTWMFVYGGHGAPYGLESPYYFWVSDIGHMITRDLDFQPFGFGFTCSTGDIYKNNNFAREWLTSLDGGISFLGATTISYATPDRYFSRKMFNQLNGHPNMTIGEFIGNAKAKYYNPDKVIWRRREAKKYVLYGDPSLYLFGLDLQYNQPYSAKQFIGNIEDNVTCVHVYSITGQLLRSHNSQPDLDDLPSGTYLMTFISDNNNITTQKIILQ